MKEAKDPSTNKNTLSTKKTHTSSVISSNQKSGKREQNPTSSTTNQIHQINNLKESLLIIGEYITAGLYDAFAVGSALLAIYGYCIIIIIIINL